MTVRDLLLELEKFPDYYTVKIETPAMRNVDERDAISVSEDEYDDDSVCIYS